MRHYLSLLFTGLFLCLTQTVCASSSHDDDNESAPAVCTVGRAHAGGSVGVSPFLSGHLTVHSYNLNSLMAFREVGLFGPLQMRYIKAMGDLAQQTGNPALFRQDHVMSFSRMPLSDLEILVDKKSLVGALDPQHKAGKAYFDLDVKLKDTSVQSLHYTFNYFLLCPTLRDATHLQILNLGNNQLRAVPDCPSTLTNLRVLDLSGNELRTLPEDLSAFMKLQELSLMRNQLTAVPDGLSKLTMLRVLNLVMNQLKTLPDGLSALMRLEQLYLGHNWLKALPNGLSRLTNLQKLYVQNNRLKALPNGLSTMTTLEELSLGCNQLSKVPDGLSALMNLQRLSLSYIKLSEFPDGLSKLTKLKSLDLAGNQLKALPDGLSKLTMLEVFYLDAGLCQDETLLNALREINRNRDRHNKISLFACSINASGNEIQVRVNLD